MCKEVAGEAILECSAKTGMGVNDLFAHAACVALCGRGYIPISRKNKTCRRCEEPSKETCKCDRMRAKVHGANNDCLHVTRCNQGMETRTSALSSTKYTYTRARAHTHAHTHATTRAHTHTHTHTHSHTNTHADL